MQHDSIYEQPVTPQQQGKTPPPETEDEVGKTESSNPWNAGSFLAAPVEFFSRAVGAVPAHLPNVEVGGEGEVQQGAATTPVEQARPVNPARPVEQTDFSPSRSIRDNPLVEKAFRRINDSPDPVLEVVNMLSGGLDNLRGAKAYQTAHGDWQLQLFLNHKTTDKMVHKTMGPFSSGPVTMDTEVAMRALLRPTAGGGVSLQLFDFDGIHPSVEGPLKNRGVIPGRATLFKGGDGEYHMSMSGQARWGLRGRNLTNSRNIVIGEENMLEPVVRGLMRDATDIDRVLADLLKVQQSKDLLSVGIQNAPSTIPGTEQFDMRVRSRSEKRVPINQEMSAGLPVKVESVDLGTDVSASLSYSRQAGVALSNINGVKINVEAFGGFKQVVSPTKLTFGRDSAGKAAVGVQFVIHGAEGKVSEPMNFSIPFLKILEELGKRKK